MYNKVHVQFLAKLALSETKARGTHNEKGAEQLVGSSWGHAGLLAHGVTAQQEGPKVHRGHWQTEVSPQRTEVATVVRGQLEQPGS